MLTVSNNYFEYLPPPGRKLAYIAQADTIVEELKITLQEPVPTRSVTESIGEPMLQSMILELKSINHQRYDLALPITLLIERIDNEYAVRFLLVDIFEVQQDFHKAIEDFGILLGDYYESLLKNEASLEINLREELKILRDVLRTR